MRGDRVGVVEVAGFEICAAQPDGAAVVERDIERAPVRVGRAHSAALTVEDPGAAVVAGADDAVAGCVGVAAGIELVRWKLAAVLEERPGALVEVADVLAAGGDDQPVTFGLGPVVDQCGADGLGGVADCDLPVVAVGAGPLLDLAASELLKRLPVPRLLLAMDLMQLVLREPLGERVKGAAGLDLRELLLRRVI